jgi:uncharacterized protein with FMN-binding domain
MLPRRGAIALSLTSLAMVLLGCFKTPDAAGTVLASAVDVAGGAAAGMTASPSLTTSGGAAAASGTPAVAGAGGTTATTVSSGTATYTGTAVQTRYGAVQVQVTISNGTITDVTTLQAPSSDQHSSSLSAVATPILASEALAAQGAMIDTVSGATYTSQGYVASLQSALDLAAAA